MTVGSRPTAVIRITRGSIRRPRRSSQPRKRAEEVGFDAIFIKSLGTIDRMSGGRLIAGVGAGRNEAEFAALGVPFHERSARTNEYLRL